MPQNNQTQRKSTEKQSTLKKYDITTETPENKYEKMQRD